MLGFDIISGRLATVPCSPKPETSYLTIGITAVTEITD
jgi:hypothetical protein